MGFLTRCKRLFSFAFLLQNRNTFFSFFLKSFLILSEKQHTPCRDTAEAMRQAARLRRAVEELGPCAPDGCCAGPLTVSVGVTVYSPARDGSAPVLQDLVSRADRALYIAKKNGRNCVVLL